MNLSSEDYIRLGITPILSTAVFIDYITKLNICGNGPVIFNFARFS